MKYFSLKFQPLQTSGRILLPILLPNFFNKFCQPKIEIGCTLKDYMYVGAECRVQSVENVGCVENVECMENARTVCGECRVWKMRSVCKMSESPTNIAVVSAKLAADDSPVFPQIIYARVDWITPDSLKLIANKSGELLKERQVTELSVATAYNTLIILSKSNPAKRHIVILYADGKEECQDCQGHAALSLCSHAVRASLKRGSLDLFLKWLVATKRKAGGLNYSKAITFGMPAGRGKKGERPQTRRHGQQSSRMVIPRIFCPSSASNQRPNMGTDTVQPREMFHLNPSNVSSQETLVHPVKCPHSRPNVPSQQAQYPIHLKFLIMKHNIARLVSCNNYTIPFRHIRRSLVHPHVVPILQIHHRQQERGTVDSRRICINL